MTLSALSDELLLKIGAYLKNESDIINLENTSRRLHSLFKPLRLLETFLKRVSYGEQDKAEQLFTEVFQGQNEKIQQVLCYQGKFTDRSSRTFTCSAYEYAYWAKDTHMCRMLERHMDDETKGTMLARIDAIKAYGLSYFQNGERHQSVHFEFTELRTAFEEYIQIHEEGPPAGNVYFDDRDRVVDEIRSRLQPVLEKILKAQLNVPAHVAHEFCWRDRPFSPCPSFKEPRLPRTLTVYHYRTQRESSWFSPVRFDTPGLAEMSSLVLLRGRENVCMRAPFFPDSRYFRHDLDVLLRLNEVRTGELQQLREHLISAAKPSAMIPSYV
ncbi:hypothetical protein [Legionella yabuuchiae]|uniref:hypothetical protein n=1 Tax=Legionella yabuuchiae TaxID=376727 RepID=UPI00105490CD|nr:hypothetical protein [Legionella yabuuchiae]